MRRLALVLAFLAPPAAVVAQSAAPRDRAAPARAAWLFEAADYG